jgi:hypothetical protein
MPYSGRCLNVGRVRVSQEQGRPRHFRSPMHEKANHDAPPFPTSTGLHYPSGSGDPQRGERGVSGKSALDEHRIE